MGKKSYVGIVDKIRVLKSLPNMLVRFTLHTNSEDINCLVSRKELATFGHYNSRNQFIIEKFNVRNPDNFIREFILKPMKPTY